MFPSPKLRRASCSLALQPTRSAPLVSADVNNNFLKHLQVCGPFTLRFFTILPIVEIESLNTSVRVCFAQPSHSGAECDPRHRGAVFCIGIQPPQRTTSTGPSPEVLATPIESTDALAAGPKHGSFLFRQLSDQSCMLFFYMLHFWIDAVTFSSAELKLVPWSSPL